LTLGGTADLQRVLYVTIICPINYESDEETNKQKSVTIDYE